MPPSLYRKTSEPLAFPLALCGVHYGADEAVTRFVPLQEGSNMVEVRIESLPTRRLMAIAHHGSYQGIGDKFKQLWMMATGHGVTGPSTEVIGIFYGDPDSTPIDELRSHACITVADNVRTAPDGCELLPLDGGEFAIGVHRGSYETLSQSYKWLFGQWLPSSGREAANSPVHELYVSGPDTAPPEQMITHICVPLVATQDTKA
jgi:AraC family transcriptional regulator